MSMKSMMAKLLPFAMLGSMTRSQQQTNFKDGNTHGDGPCKMFRHQERPLRPFKVKNTFIHAQSQRDANRIYANACRP